MKSVAKVLKRSDPALLKVIKGGNVGQDHGAQPGGIVAGRPARDAGAGRSTQRRMK
ncbi:MAG: hypothetical protein H7Z19_19735 [Chitinophagaceae bacterium]|nr:hypothetical protein [Rubrivivax sp.]